MKNLLTWLRIFILNEGIIAVTMLALLIFMIMNQAFEGYDNPINSFPTLILFIIFLYMNILNVVLTSLLALNVSRKTISFINIISLVCIGFSNFSFYYLDLEDLILRLMDFGLLLGITALFQFGFQFISFYLTRRLRLVPTNLEIV